MRDSINEVGKSLRKTKENSEAALRRYAPTRAKIERIRDIFDDVIPFEMEFETKDSEKLMSLDLYFNKPPPVITCLDGGRYVLQCQDFCTTVGEGAHLLNVGHSYFPGTVSVFLNNVRLDSSQFSEYDPVNGLVYVIVPTEPATITICFSKDTWTFQCPETIDPLNGSPLTNGDMTGTYSDHYSQTFGGPLLVDTDENTQTPQYAYDSAPGFSQYSAYIDDHSGLLTWDLEPRIQDVTNTISTTGNLRFIPTYNTGPYTGPFYQIPNGLPLVDGNEVQCTFSLDNHCGDNFGKTFVGFLGGYPERTNMLITVGPIQIILEEDHDLIWPFGEHWGPRYQMSIHNVGNMNSEGRCYNDPSLFPFDPGCITSVQELGYQDASSPNHFAFNEPVTFFINISKSQNKIEILAGGQSYTFANPIFQAEAIGFGQHRIQNYSQGKLLVGWSAVSNIVEPASFYCRVMDVHLSPCGYHPSDI
jgi:hypothetical protein